VLLRRKTGDDLEGLTLSGAIVIAAMPAAAGNVVTDWIQVDRAWTETV
jgi:hypothetical protein